MLKDFPASDEVNYLIINDFEAGMPFAPPARQEGIIGEAAEVAFGLSVVISCAPGLMLPVVRLRRGRQRG